MPEREFYSDVTATQLIEWKSYTTTQTSAAVTCDANMVAILVGVGLWTSGTFDFKLTECATSGGTYTDVAAADVDGSVPQVASTATDQADFILRYTGSLGYIKLVATGATSPSAIFGASVLKGAPKKTAGAIV